MELLTASYNGNDAGQSLTFNPRDGQTDSGRPITDIIRPTTVRGLSVLHLRRPAVQAAELLSGTRMRVLLQELPGAVRHHRARHAAGARHGRRRHRGVAHRRRAARRAGRRHRPERGAAGLSAARQRGRPGHRHGAERSGRPGRARKATTTTPTTTRRRSSEPSSGAALTHVCAAAADPTQSRMTAAWTVADAGGRAGLRQLVARAGLIDLTEERFTRMSSSIAPSRPRVAAPTGDPADEHRDRRPRRSRQEHGHRPPARRHPLACPKASSSRSGPSASSTRSRSSTPSCSTRSRTSRPRASPSTPPGCSSRAAGGTT